MSKALKLVIEMDAKGDVSLLGPIDNRLECYGLLAIAKDMIKDYHDKKATEQPAIMRPSPADVLSINGRKPGQKK